MHVGGAPRAWAIYTPTVEYRFRDLTQGKREHVVILHLRDGGVGGHYELVQCDEEGVLSAEHIICLLYIRSFKLILIIDIYIRAEHCHV